MNELISQASNTELDEAARVCRQVIEENRPTGNRLVQRALFELAAKVEAELIRRPQAPCPKCHAVLAVNCTIPGCPWKGGRR